MPRWRRPTPTEASRTGKNIAPAARACTLGEAPEVRAEIVAMQPPLPAPTASGSFLKTPFPHLLVYALERRLTGTFELAHGATPLATMLVIGGCPAKVKTAEPLHFLGDVLVDLGMI